ncbi:glutamate ABC transporter substrate-binding protein [Yinghuangia sp. ASG 101]|uniref:glutamate ABC transporter substrate-binding protein n=1 Tax=Yinghuangia sp. ASG 101 TaxID=2896848 RepID=UPI001E389C7D|nr:glutamate ABC transporter substrate-binding protein [Yinghuangia sp. ASG 101]UGQ13924.1 glutamate ABC transporter substrate-binding protein [Yinghuangia sp. ASG 101]
MSVRTTAAAVGAVVLVLLATACGGSGTGSAAKTTNRPIPATTPPLPTYQTRTGVDIASPTLAKATARGHLVVGAKDDQPGLGYLDPATLRRSGFDIEIARMVSAALGLDPATIEFKTIASVNRETALRDGDVDLYVGTYSITDERKESVGFAGPYYISGQSLLVRADETAITGMDTLHGRRVCSAKGSTAFHRLQVDFPEAQAVFDDGYGQCVERLLDGGVDAVSTDDAILKGYAAREPGSLKVVGEPFTTEKYGIGLPRADTVLREAVNAALEANTRDGTWKAAYDATLGMSGVPAPPVPPIERY